MSTVYEKHDAAFSLVSAYVIAHKSELVATVAFKFPRDGAGRLQVFVHWMGDEMVRGYAGGYGYDKRSAACACAARIAAGAVRPGHRDGKQEPERIAFWEAMRDGDHGAGWDRCLREYGFDVWSAV